MRNDLAGPEPSSAPGLTLEHSERSTLRLVLGAGIMVATLVVVDLWTPSDSTVRRVLDQALGIVAPLAALIVFALAAARVRQGVRAIWICLCIGALAVLLAQLAGTSAHLDGTVEARAMMTALAPIILYLALAAGAALATRRGMARHRGVDTLLDAALGLGIIALLLERFALHAVRDAALADPVAPWGGAVAIVAALIALFCATLLALRPDYRIPEVIPPLVLAATLCYILGIILAATRSVIFTTPGSALGVQGGLGAPGTISGLDGLAGFAGWLLLMAAGLSVIRPPNRPVASPPSSPGKRHLHRILVSLAAATLGAATIDVALRSEPTLEFGIIGAFLGVLLAIRVHRTIQADEKYAETERLLEQNYALVEVSRALADATDLNRTLDLVVNWACRLLDSPAAGVELLDAQQNELEVRALHGLPSHLLGLRTPVEGTLTGSVISSGRAVAVADPGRVDFRFNDRVDAFGTFPTAAAPLHYREERLGALFAVRFDRTFDAADLELLGALADQASLAIRNAQLFEQVRALSLTDPLTGLANRRQLARDLSREFAATRRGRRLIAVLFDLDNFKEYNDQYGHPAGDEVLRLFGQALAIETRAMNLAARYGGDEFVALLSDTPPEGARIFIQRVASRFQREMERLGRGTITISAGLAECEPGMKTPEELIAAADQALYRVKPGKLGRADG